MRRDLRGVLALVRVVRVTQVRGWFSEGDKVSGRSLFDILGPVMIGPSSSHTAGAVRLGLLARAILGGTPESASIALHGSFAATGEGHGTDLALVAGLLGMAADDPRIVHAFEIARETGMHFRIAHADLGNVHPNTARFDLERGGERLLIEGSSVGGGEVRLSRIGEFEAEASGRMPLLLVEHIDRPGEIAGVTGIIAEDGANIAEMRVSRTRRGAEALMLIETDTPLSDDAFARICEAPAVSRARRVPAV
jgi:L-serine dehydratase